MDEHPPMRAHRVAQNAQTLIAAAESLTLGNMLRYAANGAAAQRGFAALKTETLRKPGSQFRFWGTMQQLDGFVQFEISGAASMHIMEMQVTPARQGFGLGARMMEHMLRHARTFGMEEVTLVCNAANTRALGFYTQHQGFVAIARFEDAHWRAPQIELAHLGHASPAEG